MTAINIVFSNSLMVFFTILVVVVSVAAQPQEQWVSSYNGPGNYIDMPIGIALDDGNVIVTGWSSIDSVTSDFATIKYDNDGNELWIRRYGGKDGVHNEAIAFVVDDKGNIHITGFSYEENQHYKFVTVKYNKDGEELWDVIYDSSNNNIPVDITVDNDGNVYVTGYEGTIGAEDIITVKYNSAGHQLWLKTYKGSANSSDIPAGMILDSEGNLYITGYETEDNGYTDYITIKYDPAGNVLWANKYQGPGEMIDYATAITIDDSCNLYITGTSEHAPDTSGWFDNDVATIKYDKNGNELWTSRYDGGWGGDLPIDLTVDPMGNVFVTGWSISEVSTKNIATIKYDSEGNQQ